MKKIFYIEQEKFLRNMVEEALDHEGVEVYSVSSLDDCFYIIEDLKVDLILLDLKTASDRLSSFLSGLHSRCVISHIPIIVVGFSEDKKKLDGCEGGILGFMEKPLSPTSLYNSLIDFTNNSGLDQRKE